MPPCERCVRSLDGLCRQCARMVSAQHYREVWEEEIARLLYHGDVAHQPWAQLSEAHRGGWLAVADAAREMAR